MSLRSPYSRHMTPPTGSDTLQPYSANSHLTPQHSSKRSRRILPNSDDTQLTTPPRSPNVNNGPVLLPKIRTQDQRLDAANGAGHHRQSSSSISMGVASAYQSQDAQFSNYTYRSMSPPEFYTTPDYMNVTPMSGITPGSMLTPVSNITPASSSSYRHDQSYASPASPFALSTNVQQQPAHSRANSACSTQARARSGSPCYVDDAILNRYAYPTYRQVPTYVTASSSQRVSPSPAQQAPAPVYVQPPTVPHPLAAELLFENYVETPAAITLHEYLTAPNPTPSLVRRPAPTPRVGDVHHFWWDIRNLRNWDDFNFTTIYNTPSFDALLELAIPQPALPHPNRAALNNSPDTLASLQDTYSKFYCTKINAALKVALGTPQLAFRAAPAAVPGARHSPDILLLNEANPEATFAGAPRARVVGVLQAFDTWNSGMRAAQPVAYQRGLALLHRHMREHACRYGFLLTEIELVCVRAGTELVPQFGLLELAPPIQLAACGAGRITAPLALWYLGMLAKDAPLPGQCGWRLDVGGPQALTRRKHLERDPGMLKPEGREKRDARRARGWVFPDEPWSRKENGRTKKLSRGR